MSYMYVLQMPELFLPLGQLENSMTFWWFQRQTSEFIWLYLLSYWRQGILDFKYITCTMELTCSK